LAFGAPKLDTELWLWVAKGFWLLALQILVPNFGVLKVFCFQRSKVQHQTMEGLLIMLWNIERYLPLDTPKFNKL
jgi:hypothetical protein